MIAVYIHKCNIDFRGLTVSYIEFFMGWSYTVVAIIMMNEGVSDDLDLDLYYVRCKCVYVRICIGVCVYVYMYKNRTGSVENWTISKVSVEVSPTFSLYFTTILWLLLY